MRICITCLSHTFANSEKCLVEKQLYSCMVLSLGVRVQVLHDLTVTYARNITYSLFFFAR